MRFVNYCITFLFTICTVSQLFCNWVCTLAIASTTICNVLKKKETTDVLNDRHGTGRPRKTSTVDDRNIVRAVKKDPKTTVSNISNNLQRAGVKVSYYCLQMTS